MTHAVLVEKVIRPAYADELAFLSGLCLRSKGYWGYAARDLEAFRAILTITQEQWRDDLIGVLAQQQPVMAQGSAALGQQGRPIPGERQIFGLVQISTATPIAYLDKLFVEPSNIGSGCGLKLLRWAADQARNNGAKKIHLLSEPHARGFYESHGFAQVGCKPSEVFSGRQVPIMELSLEPEEETARLGCNSA